MRDGTTTTTTTGRRGMTATVRRSHHLADVTVRSDLMQSPTQGSSTSTKPRPVFSRSPNGDGLIFEAGHPHGSRGSIRGLRDVAIGVDLVGLTISAHARALSHPHSLGNAAVFLIGGSTRDVEPVPILLRSGDVVIMAGPACRRAYHGA